MLGLIDYEGPHVDSGTAYEIGFAVAHKKPVILFHQNEHPVNIMLCHTAHYYCKKFEDLINYDFVNRPANKYEGKIFWSSTLYFVISESEEPEFFSHTMKRRVLKYIYHSLLHRRVLSFKIYYWNQQVHLLFSFPNCLVMCTPWRQKMGSSISSCFYFIIRISYLKHSSTFCPVLALTYTYFILKHLPKFYASIRVTFLSTSKSHFVPTNIFTTLSYAILLICFTQAVTFWNEWTSTIEKATILPAAPL